MRDDVGAGLAIGMRIDPGPHQRLDLDQIAADLARRIGDHAGGGAILSCSSFGVPLMTVYGVPVHRAVATAAGFGAVIAVPAVAGFLLTPAAGAPPGTLGSVNLPAFTL
jgi:hypothetical protein